MFNLFGTTQTSPYLTNKAKYDLLRKNKTTQNTPTRVNATELAIKRKNNEKTEKYREIRQKADRKNRQRRLVGRQGYSQN